MNFIKQLLFALLALTFFISVPYEVAAAPKKETRKERRERKKKRKNRNEKRPIKKKITPTLEEKLSPAQVTRKIQTIRKRIETAPENVISSRDKPVFLEIFDDAVQTPIGRFTFEKATSNLNFCVGTVGGAARYASGKQCITISKESFDRVHSSKTPEERATRILSMASTLVHEAMHSVQYANNLNDRSNTSFEENITLYKLFELQASLQEDVSGYQMSNLPKYRPFVQKGTINFTPAQRFYRELFDAYKATGMTEERAHRAARTTFVETCWRSNSKTPIRIGDRAVSPTIANESIENWNISYNFIGFQRVANPDISYREAMRDTGIEQQIIRFINAMAIDIKPSFFRDKKTTAFNMPSSRRLIGYANGIRNRELDALITGIFSKGYKNGTLSYIYIETNKRRIGEGDKNYTEYYEGTRQKKSTYTYKNGKMNGIYREYDRNGQQILEIPVENDLPHGEGWSLENGKRVVKKFRHGYWYNRK